MNPESPKSVFRHIDYELIIRLGFLFAVATFGFFDATKYRQEAVRTNNMVAPEFRLYAALVGCWLVPIGLFVSGRVNPLRLRPCRG